jgi:SAM-dependent methyltransferase
VERPYTPAYFDSLREGARRSAGVIVPLVLALARPRSVVDLGCGTGTWLAVFRAHGVEDVWGVDGDYVDRGALEIPPGRFLPHDLTRPLDLGRSFDLALSLEVAEHLPAGSADTLVGSLTRLAALVLFSAAVPHQGGAHHVNEQWPAYWAGRFAARGFVPVDCLRRVVWDDDRVDWWYAQNTVLYTERRSLEGSPPLRREYDRAGGSVPALVHPKRYLEWVEWGLAQCRASHGEGSA